MNRDSTCACGAVLLVALLVSSEVVPIVCYKCGRVEEPHNIEGNVTSDAPAVMSSLASGTASISGTVSSIFAISQNQDRP